MDVNKWISGNDKSKILLSDVYEIKFCIKTEYCGINYPFSN